MNPAKNANPRDATPPPPQPWWKFKIVWLVVSGPALVVVAGITTAIIAINGADTLVDTGPRTTAPGAATPAVQARNHAATPAVPPAPSVAAKP